MDVSGQLPVITTLPRERNPGIQSMGGFMGPRNSLDALERTDVVYNQIHLVTFSINSNTIFQC